MPRLREFLKHFDPLARRASSRSSSVSTSDSSGSLATGETQNTSTNHKRIRPKVVVAGALTFASVGMTWVLVSHFAPESAVRSEDSLPFNDVSGQWMLASVSDEKSHRDLDSSPHHLADVAWQEPNRLGLGMQICNHHSLTLLQRDRSEFIVEMGFSTEKRCNDDRDNVEQYLGNMREASTLDVFHTTAGLTIRDSSNHRREIHFTRHSTNE